MAETNPIKLLLNRDAKGETVTAPAFSITKVTATIGVVLAPLATYLVKAIADVKFTSGQVVALISAILGLLAIAASADVIARAIATHGQAEFSGYVPVDPVINGRLIQQGGDVDVQIVAMRRVGDVGQFLIYAVGSKLRWVEPSNVRVSPP
jgi:hypothetical protein